MLGQAVGELNYINCHAGEILWNVTILWFRQSQRFKFDET